VRYMVWLILKLGVLVGAVLVLGWLAAAVVAAVLLVGVLAYSVDTVVGD